MRDFARPGSKFFHYRLNPFLEGTGVQEVSKVAFVVNNGGKTPSSIHIHFFRIVTILKTFSHMEISSMGYLYILECHGFFNMHRKRDISILNVM